MTDYVIYSHLFEFEDSRSGKLESRESIIAAVSSPRLRIAGVVPEDAECHAAAPSQAATTISSLLTAYSPLAKDLAAGEKATGIRKKNTRHHPRPFRPFKATFHQPTLTPPLAGLENQGDSSRPRAWRATTTPSAP